MGRQTKEQCFYCQCLISGGGRGDHFPMPERNGGETTVPCCVSCHDMKDRFPLDAWPDEWVIIVMRDMPKVSRETRIFLAKALAIVSDELESA